MTHGNPRSGTSELNFNPPLNIKLKFNKPLEVDLKNIGRKKDYKVFVDNS